MKKASLLETRILDDLCQGRRDQILKYIAEGKLQVNQRFSTGHYPLYYAVSGVPNEELVRALLIQPEIDVNIQEEDGMTPLMWAARFRNFIALCLLIEKGAEPTLQNQKGQQAIDFIPHSEWLLRTKTENIFATRISPYLPLEAPRVQLPAVHYYTKWSFFANQLKNAFIMPLQKLIHSPVCASQSISLEQKKR